MVMMVMKMVVVVVVVVVSGDDDDDDDDMVGETADGGIGDKEVCSRREQHRYVTMQ